MRRRSRPRARGDDHGDAVTTHDRAADPRPVRVGSAWDKAPVFPIRFPCTEEEYLALDSNLLLEFSDGFLEVLPMPTTHHQLIAAFFYEALKHGSPPQQLGDVLFAPLKVRIRKGKYREPDVLFMKSEHAVASATILECPDLVIEVVSPKNRRHDLETKRDEYARAGIPEYWIVDPKEETITVFVLKPRRKTYSEHGTFPKGERAESKILPGFSVDVTEALCRRP